MCSLATPDTYAWLQRDHEVAYTLSAPPPSHKDTHSLSCVVSLPVYLFDLWQVRLLELYDIVDLFVLYEIPYTHMGMEKPLYFKNSLDGACEPSVVANG